MTVIVILLAILITIMIYVILNNSFGKILFGIFNFISAIPVIGTIKDVIFLAVCFILTLIIMAIGLKIFNLEIKVSHPNEIKAEINQIQEINTLKG